MDASMPLPAGFRAGHIRTQAHLNELNRRPNPENRPGRLARGWDALVK